VSISRFCDGRLALFGGADVKQVRGVASMRLPDGHKGSLTTSLDGFCQVETVSSVLPLMEPLQANFPLPELWVISQQKRFAFGRSELVRDARHEW
jgi:hypothetical protein